MAGTALITGASGGIGRSLACRFAEAGHGLVIVARNSGKLEELSSEIGRKYGVPVTVIAADLSLDGAADALYENVRSKGIDVEFLVNNAGFGDFGDYCDRPWDKYETMMKLNMEVLAKLTYLFAGDMLKKGRGRVMNVSSMVALQAGPHWSMYSATKSFVLSLTESLSIEYKGTGVTFTALCPGPTATGFEDAAESGESKMFSRMKNMRPDDVADIGYRKMMKGKAVCVPGTLNNLIAILSKLAPRSVSGKIFSKIQ